MKIFGVDFTSAPRNAKAITVAHASLTNSTLTIHRVERLHSFAAFEVFLSHSGHWVAGFDFPFGLPRELVEVLDWPQDWRALCEHVSTMGKAAFKFELDRVRKQRPVGAKYIARRGDCVAGASSSMKLVNPPVGLMFFEGAPRLARAGVCVMPCAPNLDSRIALEAYPGFLARQLVRTSYKRDGKEGDSPTRIVARETIVARLPPWAQTHDRLTVAIAPTLVTECVNDGSGDTLDAVLCAVQAAVAQRAFHAGDARYAIPLKADDFEGWIASVA